MEFRKLTEYKASHEVWQQRSRELYDAVNAAEAKVSEIKAKQNAEVTRLVMSGEESSESLDAIKRELADARAKLELATEKREVFRKMVQPEVTPEDVVNAWKNEVLPKYEHEIYKPILDKLLQTKLAHIEAIFDYYDAIREQEEAARVAVNALGEKYRASFPVVKAQYQPIIDKHFITSQALRHLQRKHVPDNIKSEYAAYKQSKDTKKGGK